MKKRQLPGASESGDVAEAVEPVPVAAQQERVPCIERADQLLMAHNISLSHRRILQMKNRALALVITAWTKIWWPAVALPVLLRRIYESAARCHGAQFVIGKLQIGCFHFLKLHYKPLFFLLGLRQKVVLELNGCAQLDDADMRLCQLLGEVGDGIRDLARVALGKGGLANVYGGSNGGEDGGNICEHACPFDGLQMRVGKFALFIKEGERHSAYGPPGAAGQSEAQAAQASDARVLPKEAT